jgi:deoxycytidylate deaminase
MLHAETNALSLIRKGDADTICLTISPCFACAKDIVSHEIQRVFYIKEYDQCNKFKEIFEYYKIYYKELNPESFSKIKSHLQLWI